MPIILERNRNVNVVNYKMRPGIAMPVSAQVEENIQITETALKTLKTKLSELEEQKYTKQY